MRLHKLSGILALALLLLLCAPQSAAGGVEELDEFSLVIEINATDGDAGFQGLLDAPAWVRMRIFNPEFRMIQFIRALRELQDQGLTEFVWESNEPRFTEPGFALDEFLERIPEGTYRAWGRTLEGGWLFGESELTHALPAGPVITSAESYTPGEDYAMTWNEVMEDYRGGALGSEIIRYIVVAEYEAEVDGEEIKRVMEFDVDGDTLSTTIPGAFLPDPEDFDEDTFELKVEVGAEEESGNRTFTEMELDAS